MIWFGWVLWHINHCRLFKAKSSLYIYIKYMIWFGWVLWHINHCRLFNAKSFLYIYIRYMIPRYTLNESELIFFAHRKMILHISIKYEQFYLLLIICLHAVKCFQLNSIRYQSFVYTQLSDKTVLFLTLQFGISHLFIQFKCQTVLFDP